MLRNRVSRHVAAIVAMVVLCSGLIAADASEAKPEASHLPERANAGDREKKESPEAAIRAALAKPLALKYDKVPLVIVAQDLQTTLGVPVRLDSKAIANAGSAPDTPVTFAIANTSASAAIHWTLHDLGLTSVVRFEAIWITTPEEADKVSETRAYDASDLIGDRATPDGSQADDYDQLIEVIRGCICPTHWADDLQGQVNAFEAPGIKAILVVEQSQDVHDEIEALFSQLRAICNRRTTSQEPPAAGQSKPQGPALLELPAKTRPVVPRVSVAEQMIRVASAKPVSLQVKDKPLVDVIEQLMKAVSIPIVLDRKAMRDFGVDLTTPVTLESSNRTLRAILDELVHAHGLAWTFDHEVLLITTPEVAETLLLTRSYGVGDFPSYRNERGEGVPDYDGIIDVIQLSIDPTTWDNLGGFGGICPYEGPGIHAIVILQTWQTHLKVESLLARLRELRSRAPSKEDIEKLPPAPARHEPGRG